MATIDAGTAAIIGICAALGVCLLVLIVFIILYCRTKIHPDTNIRKRVISTATPGGYAEQQTRADIYQDRPPVFQTIPQPYVVEVPVPVVMPNPLPRRQFFQELPVPAPQPPPPQQPEVVIHQVVHRYEPTLPAPIPQLPLPQPPPPTRTIIRSTSWSEPQPAQDEWIMIKKTKKRRGPKIREVRQVEEDSSSSSSSSSSSEDEEDSRTRQPRRPQGVQYMMQPNMMQPNMMRSLNPYDLAVPSIYQTRPQMMAMAPLTTAVPMTMTPMGMAPMGMAPVGMAQMGAPTMAVGGMNYMTPGGMVGQAPVNTAMTVPMMSAAGGGVAGVYQPTYMPFVQRM